jgi:hypothetical protein
MWKDKKFDTVFNTVVLMQTNGDNYILDNAQLNKQDVINIPDFITDDQLLTEGIFEKLAQPIKNKKKVLVTEEEAEKYLLQTIFNLQLE